MPSGGPWVQFACFCEKVILDKEDVFTLVRVVDQIILDIAGPAPPDHMPPLDVPPIKLALCLKSGDARGRVTLRIDLSSPNGEVKRGQELSLNLEGEHRGQAVVTDIRLRLQYEGVYWFDVWCDEQLLTRIPLRVVYRRVSTGPVRLMPGTGPTGSPN